MNRWLACLLCFGLYPIEFLEHELKTYQSQFKKIPTLASMDLTATNRNQQNILVQQKFGFKKKKVEYTVAVRY